jgi:hypothetical protein
VATPEPVFAGAETRGDFGALSCRVTGSMPRGTWQHQNPFLTGGALGASGHVVTSEPSPGGWRALCLEARDGARALWHREQVWSRGADLLSLVNKGTRSAEYQQWPPGQPQESDETTGGANTFPCATFMIFVLDDFEVIVRLHHQACGNF